MDAGDPRDQVRDTPLLPGDEVQGNAIGKKEISMRFACSILDAQHWQAKEMAEIKAPSLTKVYGATATAEGLDLSVARRRPIRHGLGRDLLSESIRMFYEAGMAGTFSGVDSGDLHGARELCESLGSKAYRRHFVYRKPLVSR
jgi:hypothetical protein